MEWFKNIIGRVKISLNWNRKDSPSVTSSSKDKYVAKSGGQIIVQQGLTLSEVKEMITNIVEHKLVDLKKEAIEIYKDRLHDFEINIHKRLADLKPDELNKLRDPDLQIALAEAAVISGRKQDIELRETLANLVIGRIMNCGEGREELKNIVYNEAIKTIEKMTVDQLKIITLCYLVRYTRYLVIFSWDQFNDYLKTTIKPFMDYKDTNAEFQHIEYAGCGSIQSFIVFDIINGFRKNYSILFSNLLEESEIDGLDIPEEIKRNIIAKDEKENKYSFKFLSRQALDDWLKDNSIDKENSDKITQAYETHIKSLAEVEDDLKQRTEIGKELIRLFKDTTLSSLKLTSVGIVIAATYLEQLTGTKVNIDVWIN